MNGYRDDLRRRLVAAAIGFMALAPAAGCGPSIHLKLLAQYPALDEDCCPQLLKRDGVLPLTATLVGQVGYGETGFSGSCSYAENTDRLRRQACAAGADLVRIVAENYPNFVSTCYRVRAELYRLAEAPGQDATATPTAGEHRAQCGLLSRRFHEEAN